MKQFKKFSLAYVFQVFGVIMIFGYPGCSSNMKEKNTENSKENIIEKKHTALQGVLNKTLQVPAAIFLMQQPVAVQINLASYLNFSK